MATNNSQIKTIIDLLCSQLSEGWLYYFCAKSLNEAYQKHRITSARFFFMGTFYASLNDAILTLSKLLIDHPDSISIYYLLNYAQNNSSEFRFTTPDKIKQAIESHKQKLGMYNSLLVNVKFQRDRVLAHFDRKHVNDPASILSNPPLDMDEVETCYKELHHILNDYNLYYDKSEFYLKNIEEEVKEDLEYLLSQIGKADNE